MEQVVKRLFEQWPLLTLYFASFLESNKPAEAITIYNALNNFELKLYFSFLSYILPIVNHMNVKFQSEKVRIRAYLSTVEEGLTNIMENVIKKTSLPLPDSEKVVLTSMNQTKVIFESPLKCISVRNLTR